VLGIALFFVFSVVYLRAWGFFSAKAVGLEGLFAATVGNHLYWIAAALLLAFGVVAAAMWPGLPFNRTKSARTARKILSQAR